MQTAQAYAGLAGEDAQMQAIFSMIKTEYAHSVRLVTAVCEDDELLAGQPALALSLARRRPYLDPLNHIQVVLLSRYRDSQDEALLTILLRSINAIAAGMRNTG